MAACVDDAATVATTPLSFIADAALRESIRLDMSGAHRDLGQDEWKGATVLAGSAIEALLLWALQERERNKPGDVPAAVAALIGSKTLKGNPGAECRVPERSEQYLRSESLWRRQGDQADTIDKYQLRRRNLGRYSNVSPRFAAERDGEKKPIEAELRAVLREMTTEQPRKERRTGEASSHEYEFDANHWAHRLVESASPSEPTTAAARLYGARRIGWEVSGNRWRRVVECRRGAKDAVRRQPQPARANGRAPRCHRHALAFNAALWPRKRPRPRELDDLRQGQSERYRKGSRHDSSASSTKAAEVGQGASSPNHRRIGSRAGP